MIELAQARAWLIRHGESESNAGLPTNGPGGSPLTALGRDQAERVAASFSGTPALIVSSPFARARETAAPTLARFPDVPYEEWPVQEFTYLGELHGPNTTAEERRPYMEAYWQRSDPAYVNGDGESFHTLVARAHACAERIAERQDEGAIVVFTHALFMRAVLWSMFTGITDPDGQDMRAFRRFVDTCEIPNASALGLRRAAQGLRFLGSSIAHLAPVQTTSPAPDPTTRTA
ncbi:histidine phosphatase family protein [Actinomadura barringtoniae]|uniref:Histidine phosphatase family protein n=1 Tax=Actinomadura barringtoniae TaxID=1427535 RepID=A0A939PBI5_9ACTN|nr:histidine phosphatase family protein [Actinomadura barringtoniae]MBO2449383.1 histidine phosphatase family protein [Actinomadura barringtoniae]